MVTDTCLLNRAAPILTVILDACVIYPAPLRDLLMRLAAADLFRPRWSAAIHDEWINAILRTRPELKKQLERTRRLMDAHVMEPLVTDYEPLVAMLDLPDPKDRHVLAAAVACKASLILTKNLKDFPSAQLAPLGIEAQHPDPFVFGLLCRHEPAVLAAVSEHRASLRHPPKSVNAYLDTLHAQGLAQTTGRLRQNQDRI